MISLKQIPARKQDLRLLPLICCAWAQVQAQDLSKFFPNSEGASASAHQRH
jgi:hypothetical protein